MLKHLREMTPPENVDREREETFTNFHATDIVLVLTGLSVIAHQTKNITLLLLLTGTYFTLSETYPLLTEMRTMLHATRENTSCLG